LDQVRDAVEGQIDFEGQKLAELLANVAVSIFGLVAFVVGYVLQDIKLVFFITLGGTALTFALVVPPWPFFKQNPVRWLPVGGGPTVAVPENLIIDEKAIRQ